MRSDPALKLTCGRLPDTGRNVRLKKVVEQCGIDDRAEHERRPIVQERYGPIRLRIRAGLSDLGDVHDAHARRLHEKSDVDPADVVAFHEVCLIIRVRFAGRNCIVVYFVRHCLQRGGIAVALGTRETIMALGFGHVLRRANSTPIQVHQATVDETCAEVAFVSIFIMLLAPWS